jgi:hypothetical protein
MAENLSLVHILILTNRHRFFINTLVYIVNDWLRYDADNNEALVFVHRYLTTKSHDDGMPMSIPLQIIRMPRKLPSEA